MDWIIPLLVIDKLPRSQRAAVAEQLLPAALPGPGSQRLTLAAITAEQQVRRQSLADKSLVQEVVDKANVRDAKDLAATFPQVNRAFTGLPPALQAQIVFKPAPPPPAGAQLAVQGGSAQMAAAQVAAALPAAAQVAAALPAAAQVAAAQPAAARITAAGRTSAKRRPRRAATATQPRSAPPAP